jgi:MFS transporter, DHA2 family, multidrug resistance protein
MSATPIAARPSSASANPGAFAAALPSDLSQAPLAGIVGVILGAGVVTLAGRLLTLGLGDLKGSLGISYDQGAWIGSAFNVSLMFIGPLTVYLGAMLGVRRVLLATAAIFTLVSAYLPLVHSYSLLIVLLAIAGLTSGTFYPLTLTFALRNIPLRYLTLTLALYATCVEGALNFAPSLYGFYRERLSWEWMFWTSAVITPVMMTCIYFGIPSSPKGKASGEPPSFAGFFYASAGFALVFAALDQGQRLDWWRSGLFTGLLVSGVFLLVCSLVRRLMGPNPLIDLPYIFKWNTILLAFALFAFRFSLLATALIIPQSLAIRGFDAAQFGPAVLWTALSELLLGVVAAYFLNDGLDSRLLMAIGFACMAFACLLNAKFTSSWAAESYFPSALLMAVGQSFAFVGLVSTLILQALFSGGLESPRRILTFSAFFHVVRLFAGQIGTALMGHFIAEREQLHSFLLGLQVQRGDWVTDDTIRNLTAGLSGKSPGLAAATGRAVGIVDSRVRLQAYALTFIDAFHLIAWICVVTLLLIATLRKSPLSFGDLGALHPDSTPAPGGKS